MNKKQLIQLLLVPLVLIGLMLSITYMYWQMETNTIEARNHIPEIEKLMDRIKIEKGADTNEKLLSFTKGIRELIIDGFNAEIESLKIFKYLLLFISSIGLLWVIFIISSFKKINKNLTNSSSGTGQKARPAP